MNVVMKNVNCACGTCYNWNCNCGTKVDPDTFSIGLVQLSPRSVLTGDLNVVTKNVNCTHGTYYNCNCNCGTEVRHVTFSDCDGSTFIFIGFYGGAIYAQNCSILPAALMLIYFVFLTLK